jgi:predicted nucleic-acid-binding protein
MGGNPLRITADTNILVRAVAEDDPVQSPKAQKLLAEADLVAIPITTFVECCWVLGRVYRFPASDVAEMIRKLVDGDNVAVDMGAVRAGLAQLEAGGDFADAVIAHSGRDLGGETFVSFDKKAVDLLEKSREAAQLLK